MQFVDDLWKDWFSGNMENEYLQYMYESIEEDILCLENRIDLDEYTIENAKFLLKSILAHINLTSADTITGFNPTDKLSFPKIRILRRSDSKDNAGAEYIPQEDMIILYLLDNNYKIDQMTKSLLTSENYINIIAHELTHCYRDRATKGSGRSIKVQNHKTFDANYVNDPEEFDSLKKEIELSVWNQVEKAINWLTSKTFGNISKEFLRDIIHDVLTTIRNNKDSKDGKVLNLMNKENLNKTYKDVYEYCTKQFVKNYPDIQADGTNVKMMNSINDKINLDAWLKDHSNYEEA